MAATRLETLKSLVEQDPKNSFTRYGLAMEYANAGDPAKAVEEYRNVLSFNSGYCAAYYHGGQSLEKLGRIDEARDMYRKGIEASTRVGDLHTRSEIQAVMDILG